MKEEYEEESRKSDRNETNEAAAAKNKAQRPTMRPHDDEMIV